MALIYHHAGEYVSNSSFHVSKMDTGGFYRRGTSITSSFAGAHGDMSHSYTSTPPAGFHYSGRLYAREPETGPVYLEEKKEISELKGAVSSLRKRLRKWWSVKRRPPQTRSRQQRASAAIKSPLIFQ